MSHTPEYFKLSAYQQRKVEAVMRSTTCTEKLAIDELTAMEWEVNEAVENICHAFDWARPNI